MSADIARRVTGDDGHDQFDEAEAAYFQLALERYREELSHARWQRYRSIVAFSSGILLIALAAAGGVMLFRSPFESGLTAHLSVALVTVLGLLRTGIKLATR